MKPTFRDGLRAGLPVALAGSVLAMSFGVLAGDVGMPAWTAILMSVIVFAGSAQIAALGIIGAGGTLGAALGAAALMNSRFLPMGVAFAPSLPGGPLKRAAQGQTVVDVSLVIAEDGKGGFDRNLLFGSTLAQYVGWVTRHDRRRARRAGARRSRGARPRRDLPRVLPRAADRRAADRAGARRGRRRRADRARARAGRAARRARPRRVVRGASTGCCGA